MIAVDTNVIVRLLTGDDPKQSKRALALFEQETIFLPKTVMLETDWVLRRLYGFLAKDVAEALSSLLALPNTHCEDIGALSEALDWARKGMDFADALHLSASRRAGKFATFDVRLARNARKHAVMDVLIP
ncbi:MAG: type II toxin-antitoxin system VapC family toxin [Alphaproteobacteria bacterium]|nr:type II toxin-antitoxin system VapC family toxin [Alphaproteobacteria bacterium]